MSFWHSEHIDLYGFDDDEIIIILAEVELDSRPIETFYMDKCEE